MPLRQSIAAAVRTVAPAGALNSLAQTLLRMTVPGIPDLYQGAEFWDFSLVDPDNRRPVDYPARAQALQAELPPAQLLADWQAGAIKQALVARVLHCREQYPQLFAEGRFQPLNVHGEHADKVYAFARLGDTQAAIVIVPRLASGLLADGDSPLIEAGKWGDTHIELPSGAKMDTAKGLFAPCAVTEGSKLRLDSALQGFPVNLFIISEL